MDDNHSRKGSENKNSKPKAKTNHVTQYCKHCGRTENIQQYINDVEAENDTLKKQNKSLTDKLNRLEAELQDLTDKMAKEYKRNNPGLTESSGNRFNPSDIANILQGIYDGVFQRLVDNCEDERKGMEKLKNILISAYRYCKEEARLQVLHLLRPTAFHTGEKKLLCKTNDEANDKRWEDLTLRQCLTESEIPEIYRLRFAIAQSKEVTEYVQSECKAFLIKKFREDDLVLTFRNCANEISEEEDADINQDLMDYFDQCAECCWLITTCWPPLELMFCRRFQNFDKELEKFFRIIERDYFTDRGANVITQVVWPVVVQTVKDKTGFFKEGYVYVNDQRITIDPAVSSPNVNKTRIET